MYEKRRLLALCLGTRELKNLGSCPELALPLRLQDPPRRRDVGIVSD